MSFYKTVRLIEGDMVQDNFKLLSPLDYEEVIIRYPLLDRSKKKYIEWCKVVTPNKKSSEHKAKNVEVIKEGLMDIPEEVIKTWKRGLIVLGRDIMYHYGMGEGEGIDGWALYLMSSKKGWDKHECLPSYLKPSGISNNVKDRFRRLYS